MRASLGPALAFRSWRYLWGRRSAYVAAYAAVVVLLALVEPVLLVPIGLVAAGATAAGLWCSRTSYGTTHGLPPGRLPLVAVAPVVDHDFYAKEAARLGPVFKTVSPVLPTPTVCVVGLARGLSLLRRHEQSLGPITMSFDPLIPRRLLRHMSPDDHRHYRKIFQGALDDEVIAACLPELRSILADGLSRLAGESSEAAGGGVAPRPHLERMVLATFVRLFLGLAPGSADAERAVALLLTIGVDVGGAPGGERYRAVEAAAAELAGIVERAGQWISERAATGAATPPSFLSALLREHPDALGDPAITFNLVFLLRTGATDVTGLLHWILELLGKSPSWVEAVRASDEGSDLPQRVVMETLRLEQSELIFRRVTQDIDVEGFRVPAGWHLRLCIRESHQDPEVFEEPERFDPDRFLRRPTRNEYSPLGALGHTCLGVKTIHSVAGAFVRELAAGYELSVVAQGRPEFILHWWPGRRHRIALRRRSGPEGAGAGGPTAGSTRAAPSGPERIG